MVIFILGSEWKLVKYVNDKFRKNTRCSFQRNNQNVRWTMKHKQAFSVWEWEGHLYVIVHL